ncbi:MAG: PQQ-binding-like beta-propeller repeat protein [Planctomycetota bacterium]
MAFAGCLGGTLHGQEWPRFRGPNGAGVAVGGRLPADLAADGVTAWRTPVAGARSSPVLDDGHVFVTAAAEEGSAVLCLSREDGSVVWSRRFARARHAERHELNDPASPTPAVDEGSVYAFFPELGVVALDKIDGRQRWLHALAPLNNQYGMASSPIVAGDSVVLLCDQVADSFLLALDAETGDVRWQRPRPAMTGGWSTPVLFPSGTDPTNIITFGCVIAHGYDLETGDVLWNVGGLGWPVSSPVIHGDRLLCCAAVAAEYPVPSFAAIAAGYDRDADGKIASDELHHDILRHYFARTDRDGDRFLTQPEWDGARASLFRDDVGLVAFALNGAAPREAWRVSRSPSMVATPLVYREVAYMIKSGGILTTIDADTGEVLQRRRIAGAMGEFYASPVAGDGKVYVCNTDGRVFVLAAGREPEVLSTHDLGEPIFATPAIGNDGSLFLRTADALYCFRAR